MKQQKIVRAGAALATTFLLAGAAQAQVAGTWSVRLGATHISPQVKSGNLSAPSFRTPRSMWARPPR